MVTAKIPGVNTPCQNLQKMSCPSPAEVAASKVGSASRKAAGTITCLRPRRSEIAPANGPARATARVDAVTTRLAAAADTWNVAASIGSSGCGAKSVKNAQKPAHTTAAVRVRDGPAEQGAACSAELAIFLLSQRPRLAMGYSQ